MSNRPNHRRGELRRTENGPRWENHNPSKGSNSTHVARARRWWKKLKNRTIRRTGKVSPKYHALKDGRPEHLRALPIEGE
ncbi:MAG: hypothetical protein ACYTEX_11160 [Planctomycetota bacterium]